LKNRGGRKPVTEKRSTIRSMAKVSSPPIQVILVVFVALFILFLWLNFVLTQEIESIGREIQAKTEELRAIERRQSVLLKEISVLGSQERMAEQAWILGYRTQQPVYLSIAEPLGQPSALASTGEWSGQRTESLWAVLAGQNGTLASETIP
jgi:cell division protein FtsB